MSRTIYTIWSQELGNGKTGEFGIDDDGHAYWNGKSLVTEEKVALQWWVSAAIIVTALATVGQAFYAGLVYRDTHVAHQTAEKNALAEAEHWKTVAIKAYTEAFIAKSKNAPGKVTIPKGTRLFTQDGGKTFLVMPPDNY